MEKNLFLPYQKDSEIVLKHFKTKKEGLSKSSAEKRLGLYGKNIINDIKKESLVKKVLRQLKNPMVLILAFAFLISLILKEHIDAWVILSVILVNTFFGFIHEYRVEKSIEALKKISVPFAKVLRDGEMKMIKTDNIVPGDIIKIEEGDRIPADGRIIKSVNLKTIESALTGESESVDKNHYTIHAKLPIADRKNMVWSGTFVTSGSGLFVVTETGQFTAFGRIAKSLLVIKKEESIFTQKIKKLSKQSSLIAILLAIIIFFVSVFTKDISLKETFVITMASLVSIIPEGMLALFSIILAIGAKRMSDKKAIIKNLTATESVGAITTIITDKTGTLTQNIMMVENIKLSNGEIIGVSGFGWDSVGFFHKNSKIIDPQNNTVLNKLLKIISICNNAKINQKENSDYEIIGEPTEAALIIAANKASLTQEILLKEEFKIDEPAFDSNKKYREVLIENNKGEKFTYIVGAPEKVLSRCSHIHLNEKLDKLKTEDHDNLKKDIDKLADLGLRTLAVAYKKVDKKSYKIDNENTSEMVYIGTVGLKDPIRQGVKESIRKAQEAGIRIIMATGDHKNTAIAIAKEIGIDSKYAVSEEDLENKTNEEFENIVSTHNIFSRVSPETKLKIAETLQKQGEFVAMTGDGINDAPALKKSDVGISMGKIGTDVARESSQIVLTDDNFNTIIDAIEEGRLVFRNIQKTGTFLLSKNFALGLIILLTMIIGLPLPLLPTQILWLNLVTDSLAGIPLAGESAHENLLKEKPSDYKENILSKRTWPFTIIIFIVMVAGAITIFKMTLPLGVEKSRTFSFLFIGLSQLFNVLNLRSFKVSTFKISIFKNKYLIFGLGTAFLANIIVVKNEKLRSIFHLTPVNIKELMLIITLSSTVILFAEIYKMLKKRKNLMI